MPYPIELAERLIRMFSFVGDTVLDPFMGTASTNIAAAKWGRNSIGIEVDEEDSALAERRLRRETAGLFATATISTATPEAERCGLGDAKGQSSHGGAVARQQVTRIAGRSDRRCAQ